MADLFIITLIVLFFIISLLIGYFASKKETTEGYLIADRKLGLFQSVMTLSGTFIGAMTLLVYTAFVFVYGISALWILIGYFLGFILFTFFALHLKNYSSNKKFYTITDYFSSRFNVKEVFAGLFSDLKFDFAASLINNLRSAFEAGNIDKVAVVANEFKSVMQQRTVTKQILPIAKIDVADDESKFAAEFIFEPDKVRIINTLLPRHLNALFWKMLLESFAAELGARMTAMDMATENAKELIRTLQITYNKERQASITSEILEIVSGANALKGE